MKTSVLILDASALLALLHEERGGDVVEGAIKGGCAGMSSVNYSEVIACLQRTGHDVDAFETWFSATRVHVYPFDRPMAKAAGLLKARANKLGLSLADCACLCLAKQLDAVALTADTAWSNLKNGFNVEVIRQPNTNPTSRETTALTATPAGG